MRGACVSSGTQAAVVTLNFLSDALHWQTDVVFLLNPQSSQQLRVCIAVFIDFPSVQSRSPWAEYESTVSQA
jgi:hypothetical protein